MTNFKVSLLLSALTLVNWVSTFRISGKMKDGDEYFLPRLPSCSEEFENPIFERMWTHYLEDQDNGDEICNEEECDKPLTVFLPSISATRELIPLDIANPFENDRLLRHLTIFSHVVNGHIDLNDLKEEDREFISLNGGKIIISNEKIEGRVFQTVNGLKVSVCEVSCRNGCILVYAIDGILEVTHADVEFSLQHQQSEKDEDEDDEEKDKDETETETKMKKPESENEDQIIFRTFELPTLNPEIESILRNQIDGSLFADIWKRMMEEPTTMAIDVEEMIVLVPTSYALNNFLPPLREEVPNPLENDVPLQQHILSNHLIIREGSIPERILETLPEYYEILKINLEGRLVVFHREDTKGGGSIFKVNGQTLSDTARLGEVLIYSVVEVLFQNRDQVDLAVGRMAKLAGVDNPYPVSAPVSDAVTRSPYLETVMVPRIENTVSFALRSRGAAHFANIWLDVKDAAQKAIAKEEEDDCLLPKEVGPCRQVIGKFYYNFESGKCAPFIYGGCEGNKNNFDNILDCSETCVRDLSEKQRVRDRTCQLPKYLYEVENAKPLLKSFECTKEISVKYHFNGDHSVCEEFIYSGCFATDNVFDNQENCQAICEEVVEEEMVTNDKFDDGSEEPIFVDDIVVDRIRTGEEDGVDICILPPFLDTPIAEACNFAIPKWTFDQEFGKCSPVFYNGCGATSNLFDTQYQCNQACPETNKGVLSIYAPNDKTVEQLFSTSDSSRDIFIRDLSLGRSFVLSALSYEECKSDTQEIATLHPDVTLQCSNMLEDFKEVFDGGHFKIFLTDRLTISENDLIRSEQKFPVAELRKSMINNEEMENEITLSLEKKSKSVDFLLRKNGLASFADAWDTTVEMQGTSAVFQDVCSQTEDQGEAAENNRLKERFSFNSVSGFCQNFEYHGQGGNQNNFNTYDECTKICGTFEGRVAVVNVLLGGEGGKSIGNLTFTQASPDHPVLIRGQLQGLSSGLHGFHIHEIGNLTNGCKSSGGHYNPDGENHGDPEDEIRHVGDLGNINVKDGENIANVDITDNFISLYDTNVIIGRAVIVHEGEDDLGKGGDNGSLSTGNAGGRFACGIVNEISNNKKAIVKLTNGLEGDLILTQNGPLAPMIITGNVKNLENGLHGFHIHQTGELGEDCKLTGGHFNPFNLEHGAPRSEERHVGDLGNIFKLDVDADAKVEVQDHLASLYPGFTSVTGRAIVIHSGPDDLGLGEAGSSLTTGNAGGRVGCGVIEPILVSYEAEAKIKGHSSEINGYLRLKQVGYGGSVHITGTISGLSEGNHGFHVNTMGSTEDECKDAGSLYNPLNFDHSSKDNAKRHIGDLGHIVANANGIAEIDMVDDMITLTGEHSIVARNIVVKEKEENLENDEGESKKDEDSDPRVACGVIFEIGKQPLIILAEEGANYESLPELSQTSILREDNNDSVNLVSASKNKIQVELKEDGEVSVIGADATNRISQSGINILIIKVAATDNSTIEKDVIVKLPVEDPALREAAEEAGVTKYFDIWDRYLESQGDEITDFTSIEMTIVAAEDEEFYLAIPADAPDPFVVSTPLQRTVLESSIVRDKRISEVDERLWTEDGISLFTIGGHKLHMKYEGDVITVNGSPVQSVVTSSNSVLYIMKRSLGVDSNDLLEAISSQ